MRLKNLVAAGLAGILMSGGASALTLTTGATTCDVSNFTIGGSDSLNCEGAYDGNDSNQNLDGVFGLNDWTQIVKVDDPATGGTGNGVTLTVGNPGGTSGTWSVDTWGGFTTVMAVLKGGPTFSAYELDTTLGTFGSWDTSGILKGNDTPGPGLSHLTLYWTGTPPDPTGGTIGAVPLPAAMWLLLAGIGGLAAIGRRRSAS